jgi:hypothetical protein
MDSVQRLLKVAPWLDKGRKPRPANTNTLTHTLADKVKAQEGQPVVKKAAKVRKDRRGCVSLRQYQQAKDLAKQYGYVISVDDQLVLANDERSPLVIGLDNRIPPANDNSEVKGKKGKKAA